MVGRRNNEDIQEINQKLKDYCEENKLEYIDLYTLLVDDDGNLSENYTKDGLHMSEEGYEAITDKLHEYID